MLSLCILYAFLGLLWLVNKKRKGRFLAPSVILLTAYCLCSLGTLYLYCYEDAVLDPVAVTYYVVALGMLLLPVVRFDETRLVAIQATDTKSEVCVSYFLAMLGLYSVAYNCPNLYSALRGNLEDSRMLTTAAEYHVGDTASVLATYAAYLFSLMIPLGFYWLATRRRPLLGVALLVGSCSYVVLVLNHVGRDVLIMWGSAFTFNFLLFRKRLPALARRWILAGYSVALLILGVLFLMITSARFPTGETGPIYPYANYAGQSPIHFSEHFLTDRPLGYGKFNFNFAYRAGALLGLNEYDQDFLEHSVKETLSSENYFLNVFSSIVGSFFLDFGKDGTIAFVACVSLVMCLTLGRGGQRISLPQVILYTMYMQVMTGGIFYYFYYPNVGNGALAFSVGTAVAIKYARASKQKSEMTPGFARQPKAAVTKAV